jgi:hypothetical protein
VAVARQGPRRQVADRFVVFNDQDFGHSADNARF